MKQTVITYSLAYGSGEVDLCAKCENDAETLEFFGTLGQVNHGAHDGVCYGCDRLADGSLEPIRRLIQAAGEAGDTAMVECCRHALYGAGEKRDRAMRICAEVIAEAAVAS